MNKIKLFFALCAASFLLTACATSTSIVKYNEATPVPDTKLGSAFQKYKEEKENSGTIIVVRDSGLLGAAGTSNLFMSGELIAKIYTSESVKLFVNPGEYILGIGPGVAISEAETKKYMEEQALVVEAGKTYYYRISVVMQKGLVLQRTTQIQ